jgi:hypothetical protein
MKDGMKALITTMAHVRAQKDHAMKVKSVIQDRAGQYAESVKEQSKRLDVSFGDALAPGYDSEKRLRLTRERGMLEGIQNN